MQNISREITKPLDEGPGTEQVWQVTTYYAAWNFGNHKGSIRLYNAFYNNITSQTIDSPAEFSAVVDLLRNEKPMFYNTWSGLLYTQSGQFGEVVGEEES